MAKSAVFATAFFVLFPFILLPHRSNGHGYLKTPRSRNIRAFEDGMDPGVTGATANTPRKDWCSHCVNRKGICGAADVSNKGYDYNQPLSILGNVLPFTVQETYQQGQEIEIEHVITAHHKGHTELKACPIASDNDVPFQSCFDAFPLQFIKDEIYGLLPDNNYRARSYIWEGHGSTFAGNPSGYYHKLKYKLPPNLNGDRILFQWRYVTANTCFDVGYSDYNFPFSYPNLADCHQPLPWNGEVGGPHKPEQFWNCAEVRIIAAPGADPTPIPKPQDEDYENMPTPAPKETTSAPTLPRQNRCGSSWADAVDACRPVDCVSNNDCESGQWCYALVGCQSPVDPPPDLGSEYYYCGLDRIDAKEKCAETEMCPSGLDSECPPGQFCFRKVFECASTLNKFCGESEADANERCTLPCPNGDSECPDGQSCFDDITSCYTSYVTADPPSSSPPPPAPTSTAKTSNYCGTSWSNANTACATPCPDGTDADCPGVEKCFADCTSCLWDDPDSNNPSDHNFCGGTWTDANQKCTHACPNGIDSECPTGQNCWADTCFLGGGDNYNYCGTSWSTANSNCNVSCFHGTDGECPTGQKCFSDCTSCSSVLPQTPAPTRTPVPTSTPEPTSEIIERHDSRLIAYVGNWHRCPTSQQVEKYTHIVIAFAVSYTWAQAKNNCSPTCEIAAPAVCDNLPNDSLIKEWQATGKKVILSFGGAGMGGSWSGDVNDCWDYCFGREGQVVNRLVDIVDEMGLDGVDLDYEYFYENNQNGSGFNKGTEAQKFLKDVTLGLRNSMPAHKEITHAPMDSDAVPGKAYYNILVDVGSSLDFLMPQYYNGITRPVSDGIDGGSKSALSHLETLAENVFGGDVTKIVFGFCISDCSGTGSNANSAQAAKVMSDLSTYHECNGGAFFWVTNDDLKGEWSNAVSNVIEPFAGCADPTSNPTKTSSPTTSPTTSRPTKSPAPTSKPTLPVTNPPFNLDCDINAKMSVNIGYYQSWAVWRPGCMVVQPEDIDVEGMGYTHLIYAFASISSSLTIESWNGVDAEEIPRMIRMNALKQKYTGLKTLIGVGGWTHNNPGTQFCNRFSEASLTPSSRETFANSVVDFLRTNNFDGIDFDWEYPGDASRCGRVEDKENYALLVEAVRDAMDITNEDYLISMALPVSISRLDLGYNLPHLAANLDFFNVMTYDIAGSWSSVVGSHTDMRHIREVMPYFLSQGVPSSSLVIGLGAYGRTFSLTDNNCIGIGCPFNGARGGGCPVWDEKGYTAYVTILETIASGNYIKLQYNSLTESMELITNDYEFISFDSEETFSIKASYASELCMGGYMWWAVDMIKESFKLDILSPTASPAPTKSHKPTLTPTKTPEPTTQNPTDPPVAGPACPADYTGYVPYLECTHYFYCQDGDIIGEVMKCSENTLFDTTINNCNYISNGVVCDKGPTQSPAPTKSDAPTLNPSKSFSPTVTNPDPTCRKGYSGWEAYLDCTQYYYCQNGVPSQLIQCPDGTIFDMDPHVLSCVLIDSGVVCKSKPTGPTSSPAPTAANQQPPCPTEPMGVEIWLTFDGCKKYFSCLNGGIYHDVRECPKNQLFNTNPNVKNCDWEYNNVVCEDPNPTASPAPTVYDPKPKCPAEGNHWITFDGCKKYFQCVGGVAYQVYECGDGLLFNTNPHVLNCDLEANVICEDPNPTASPSPTVYDPKPKCPAEGNHWITFDGCKKYFQCAGGVAYQVYECGDGLLFNTNSHVLACDWEANVVCDNTSFPTRSPHSPQTPSPTKSPTSSPTKSPTSSPTKSPTSSPTKAPTSSPPCSKKNDKYMYIEIDTDGNVTKDKAKWAVYTKNKQGKFKTKMISGSLKNKDDQVFIPKSECMNKKKCYKIELKEKPKGKQNKGMKGYLKVIFGNETKNKSNWKKGKKYSVTVGKC